MALGFSDGGIEHRPVLLEEILRFIDPKPGGTYVDCTLGAGGHAAAILQRGGKQTHLIGIDRDEDALERSKKNLGNCWGTINLVCDRFENIKGVLSGRKVDGIVMDLGVSSFMIDTAERGFSFQKDGPLDMRMDQGQSLTAEAIIKNYSEGELARIFRKYGEERYSRKIAATIATARSEKNIASTLQLAEIIKSAVPPNKKRTHIHPATKVFQALRIEVNGELENLETALSDAIDSLNLGGRLAVISFHSLEDRIVKRTFSRLSKGCICPPKFPICACGITASVKPLTRRVVKPGSEEMKKNSRSRSARLRAVERIAA